MCEITSTKASFQLHMGISRGIKHYVKYLRKQSGIYHKNLSLLLHAFAAKVMIDYIDPNKAYLITMPMKSMRNILEQNLPKQSYWVSNEAEYPIYQTGVVTSTTDLLRSVTLSLDFKFVLSRDSEVLVDIDRNDALKNYL